jgi:hypothetical protein
MRQVNYLSRQHRKFHSAEWTFFLRHATYIKRLCINNEKSNSPSMHSNCKARSNAEIHQMLLIHDRKRCFYALDKCHICEIKKLKCSVHRRTRFDRCAHHTRYKIKPVLHCVSNSNSHTTLKVSL